MKIKNLLFGMLACTALVGCSSDDEPNVPVSGESYVAINIVSPGGSSRGNEGGYEIGSEAENAANNALFVFFDKNDKVVEAQSIKLSWSGNTSTSPQVEKISNAVLVLNKDAATTHAKVVAILNTNLLPTSMAGKSLSEVCALADDYSSTESFVMSSTVYFDATGAKKIASDLTAANFATSEEAATEAPVEVYVERVLARVDAAQASNMVTEGKDVTLDQETEVTLSAKILGYKLYSTSEKSYLIKNVADDVKAYSWDWNDAANKRTYWATIPANMEYNVAISYNDITDLAANATEYKEYVQENTDGKTETADKATKLLVKAKLQMTVGETTEDAGTILQYKGMYFTEAGFLTLVNSSLQGYTYSSTVDGVTVTSNDWMNYIKIAKSGASNAKAWEVVAVLDDTKTFPGSDDLKNKMKEALSNLGTAWCWNGGAAYFYVDIEHFGAEPQNVGIVRNHIYELSISKISGLGTPVYDPDEDIVPEKTDEEPSSYVAARINILKWKIVNQNVTLD